MIKRNGYYFPDDDTNWHPIAFNELEKLQDICDMIDGRDCAVQAGGNVGIFANQLAKTFKSVITFEPAAKNWECLIQNCDDSITKYNAGLSDVAGRGRIVGPASDCGCWKVQPGDDFDVVTIDSLGLSKCDLIYLDIEGHEQKAIIGAMETIKRCRPVIVTENKGLILDFRDGRRLRGKEGSHLFRDWMLEIGYRFHERIQNDDVFIPL